MIAGDRRRRVALAGAGFRGTYTWGRQLLAECGAWVELVGLCDANRMRARAAQREIGAAIPAFVDVREMISATRPETVIVASRDDTHADVAVAALEGGADILVEKPMGTTREACGRILAAERRTGRRVDVAFNYRFAPTARRLKQLLLESAIGEIVSIDFHWYLDTHHGADYFRRWHAFLAHSGSLFVHKATHHFDLLNWYLASDPVRVFAQGALNHYGRRGPFRGARCRGCDHASRCPHHVRVESDARLELLYEAPSEEDGYVRDACVFREDIDIPDTMSATMLYANGVQVSYSLNTFIPIEGYHLAFNGKMGRIEIRQYERQAWATPPEDEITVMSNSGAVEHIRVPHQPGGHFGGDAALMRMLFSPGLDDPLGQRAGARAGAMSVLAGLAAFESTKTGAAVAVTAPEDLA